MCGELFMSLSVKILKISVSRALPTLMLLDWISFSKSESLCSRSLHSMRCFWTVAINLSLLLLAGGALSLTAVDFLTADRFYCLASASKNVEQLVHIFWPELQRIIQFFDLRYTIT